MSKNKKRPISIANQAREAGFAALGTTTTDPSYNGRNINPVAFYNPNKEKYMRAWTQYDLNQYCSSRNWKGLPNGIKSWNFQRMRYFHGSLSAFNFAGGKYVFPYTITGGINPYGLPNSVRPITYNGGPPGGKSYFYREDFKLDVNKYGDEIEGADKMAYILYSNIPTAASGKGISPYYLNKIFITEIADTLARVNINIVVSNKKLFVRCKDKEQAKVVRMELEASFGSDSPFVVLDHPYELDEVNTKDDYYADDLFNTVKNWDAIRSTMNGYEAKNFGTEKKERLTSGELQGNEIQSKMTNELRLMLEREWCEQVNKHLGWNVSVEDTTEKLDKYEEVNGNNKTKMEEEREL